MLMIVDGYNLMFHENWRAVGSTLEAQREHLLRELGRYRASRNPLKMIVVFDGRLGIGPYDQTIHTRGVDIVYSTSPGKADETIVELAHQCSGARVVTADRKLGQRVKAAQAVVILPSDFLKEWRSNSPTSGNMDDKQTPAPPQSQTEVQEWLNFFGLASEIAIPPDPDRPKHDKPYKQNKPKR